MLIKRIYILMTTRSEGRKSPQKTDWDTDRQKELYVEPHFKKKKKKSPTECSQLQICLAKWAAFWGQLKDKKKTKKKPAKKKPNIEHSIFNEIIAAAA